MIKKEVYILLVFLSSITIGLSQNGIEICCGNDVGLNGNGYLVLGQPTGQNIGIDDNEIMARNNGGPSNLYLQIEGGATQLGGEINLNIGISSGIALRVNDSEALWYNGTYFSWGFGGSANFFSDNVGIGVSNPTEKLEIVGNVVSTGFVKGDRLVVGEFSPYFIGEGTSITSSGNFLATSGGPRSLGHPDQPWNRIFSEFDVTVVSDFSKQKNIQPLRYGLEDILALKPITYHSISDPFESTHLGLSAEEVKQLIPEIVSDSYFEPDLESNEVIRKKSSALGIRYGELIPILIKAIQDQHQIIIAKNKEVDDLIKKMDDLIKREERINKRLLSIEKAIEGK